MGNNHDKYFGSDKRKIIILGLDDSGKTSKNSPTQPFCDSSAKTRWTSIHKKQKISTSKISKSRILILLSLYSWFYQGFGRWITAKSLLEAAIRRHARHHIYA